MSAPLVALGKGSMQNDNENRSSTILINVKS